MKTPKEIKKGMEIVVNGCLTCYCCFTDCPYNMECHPMNEDTNVDMPKQMAADAIAYIQQLENHIGELTEKVAQLEAAQPRWISVSDRLPDNEVDVLVCVTRKHYSDPSKNIRFVAKAFHTDGKTNTEHSRYVWSSQYVDMKYDEEADAYIIPDGWWESVDYEDEFSAVDDFVTHWMPLPEPPKEGE